MIRSVVSIHEQLCNGCGECVPACEEGAIEIIHGKAKLVAENLWPQIVITRVAGDYLALEDFALTGGDGDGEPRVDMGVDEALIRVYLPLTLRDH